MKYSEESAVKWKCGRTRTVASQKWSSSSCTSQRKTKLKLPSSSSSSSSAILPPNHLLQGNWCEGGKGKGMQSTWVKVGKEEEEVHHHRHYSVSVSGQEMSSNKQHSTLSFIIKVQQRGNRLTADWLVWAGEIDWPTLTNNFDQPVHHSIGKTKFCDSKNGRKIMRGSTGSWQNGELTKHQKREMQQSIGRRSILSFSFFLFTGDSLKAVTTLPYKCCQLIVFAEDTDTFTWPFHRSVFLCFFSSLCYLLSLASLTTGDYNCCFVLLVYLFVCHLKFSQMASLLLSLSLFLTVSVSICYAKFRETEETADFACLTQILFGRGSSTCWHGQSMEMVMVMEVAVVAIAC